jgi:para-nitrobenzyl esterase
MTLSTRTESEKRYEKIVFKISKREKMLFSSKYRIAMVVLLSFFASVVSLNLDSKSQRDSLTSEHDSSSVTSDRYSSSLTSEQEIFISDLHSFASLPDATPTRVLSQASIAQFSRKVSRFSDARASGKLGDVIVHTSLGPLVGIGGGNATTNQFLGVPFAAPPIGPLRWVAPQPPIAWAPNTRNATWFSPGCMQDEWYWGILGGISEDCLYLNIYVPNKTPPPGGFPVMLFWYGGSFTYGAATFPLYDGETDVALTKDVILVTSGYRLGVFGFLAGDELRDESSDSSVGNYGLQDQTAALHFIQNEIAAFGGDTTRVTIFGESAGGASVSNHLVAPRSLGLFSGAIIESGSFSDWTAQPYNISKTRLPQVAANVKCPTSGPTMLSCLRAINETEMLAADKHLTSAFLEWSPVIDGVEVLDDPRALLAAGKVAPVPVMMGFNADEGTLFNSAPTDLNASGYVSAIADIIGQALAPTVAAEYPISEYESPWWAICATLRDSQMLCPATQSAARLANPDRPGGIKPAFVYYYNYILLIIDVVDIFKNLRCFHGSELVSVFDFTVALIGDGEQNTAAKVVEYWTNFAVSGDPNGPNLPTWPAYGDAHNVAMISTGGGDLNFTVLTGGVAQDKCDFWQTIKINSSSIFG